MKTPLIRVRPAAIAILCGWPLLQIAALPALCGEAPSVQVLSKALSKPVKRVAKKLQGVVVVSDFVETGDESYTSEFGQLLAEAVSSQLVGRSGKQFRVVDRKAIVDIMRDSVIFGNSQTIDRLQAETGLNVLVSGSYSLANQEIVVGIKAASAQDGKVLASEIASVKRTPSLERMCERRFSKESGPGDANKRGVVNVDAGVFYEGGDERLHPLRDGMVLTSHDNYAVYVRPLSDCYLYVYQSDASQVAVRLFPNSQYSAQSNPLKGGQDYWIPEGNQKYFFLDEKTGTEAIYLFATRKRSAELEKLDRIEVSQMRASIQTMGLGGVRGSEAIKTVSSAQGNSLDLAVRKLTYDGDFYYQLSFIHH